MAKVGTAATGPIAGIDRRLWKTSSVRVGKRRDRDSETQDGWMYIEVLKSNQQPRAQVVETANQ
jgi:hypothetical protein